MPSPAPRPPTAASPTLTKVAFGLVEGTLKSRVELFNFWATALLPSRCRARAASSYESAGQPDLIDPARAQVRIVEVLFADELPLSK